MKPLRVAPVASPRAHSTSKMMNMVHNMIVHLLVSGKPVSLNGMALVASLEAWCRHQEEERGNPVSDESAVVAAVVHLQEKG